ncbi:MAG: hypothetical protein R2710_06940 [Acidimicrobiales bacterium]
MTTHTNDTIDITENSILDDLRGTRDLLSVGRVFGDPITAEGVTIIPVARISGGAGGGGGKTPIPTREDEASGAASVSAPTPSASTSYATARSAGSRRSM